MSHILNLCQDPMLKLVERQLGAVTLLRRPTAAIAPLDVLQLSPRGWRSPPDVARVGPLSSVLQEDRRWQTPSVRSAPAAAFRAQGHSKVTQSLAVALLRGVADALPELGPKLKHSYAGADELVFELEGVEEHSIDALGVLPRFRTTHPSLVEVRAGEASLFLVLKTLTARRLRVRDHRTRDLLYDLRVLSDEGSSARFALDEAATVELSHVGAPLAFAVQGVELAMTADGSAATRTRERPVMFSGGDEAPAAGALVAPEIALDIAPSPPPPRAQAPALDPLPALAFGGGDLLVPAIGLGASELRGLDGLLTGLAQVTEAGGRRVEDALVRTDARLLRVGAGERVSASAARAPSRAPFSGRRAFIEEAWSRVGWSSAQEALYQCASVQTGQVRPGREARFLSALLEDLAPSRVLRVHDLQAGAFGVALVEQARELRPDEWGRVVHQLLPTHLAAPPQGAVRLEDMGELEAAAPPQQLTEWVSEGMWAYVRCDCVVRRVGGPWGLSALLEAPQPGPLRLPGVL